MGIRLKEIKIEKGKADCSIFQPIYLSSIANKFAICMGIRLKEIKIEKGKAGCSIFQPIYLSSIANKFAICMGIKMKKEKEMDAKMKRKIKRVFAIVLTLSVFFSFTACHSKQEEIGTKDGKVKIRAYLGGGDLSEKIDKLVMDFNAQSKTTEVEVVPMPADTSSMITVMFNSGNTPTVMGLETGDLLRAKDRLADVSDLDAVKYASNGTIGAAEENGKINGVPYRIEGMGLIYNKKVLDKVFGVNYDPASISTLEELRETFEQIREASISPIVLGAQDWSLSTHLATDIYTGQSEDAKEQANFVERLKRGEEDLASNQMFQMVMDTIDLLKEYNYYGDNPLLYANDGDTTKQARILTEGKAAFWFQGNWGSTSLEALDAEGEYGMIPLPVGNDDTYPNNRIATLVPMYLSIYSGATKEQQQAGKELINYITQTQRGWDFVVNDAKGVPAYDNAAVEIENGIAKSISDYKKLGKTKVAYMANTADHYVDTGAALQRYLDNQIGREEVAKAYEAYFRAK